LATQETRTIRYLLPPIGALPTAPGHIAGLHRRRPSGFGTRFEIEKSD
jgi:hypothetical protein